MLSRISIAVFAALIASGAAAADPTTRDPVKVPAGTFALDPRHASLVVKIPHMGFSHYTLRFNRLDGAFTYDRTAYRTAGPRLSSANMYRLRVRTPGSHPGLTPLRPRHA